MPTSSRALSNDAALTQGSGEDDNEGVADMVMDGGVEADAMRARDVVATIGGMEMRAPGTSAVCAGGRRDELRRTEEEVQGEGGDIVVGNQETEAVRDGDTP